MYIYIYIHIYMRTGITQKKAEIREMSILVGELTLSNEHQLRYTFTYA
jgi:hypothetical protein